jgi:hypothetical protein
MGYAEALIHILQYLPYFDMQKPPDVLGSNDRRIAV